MGKPDIRSVPLPEGVTHVDKTRQERQEAKEFDRFLVRNQPILEEKGFNLFNDKIMLEMVYHGLLKSFAGEGEIDAKKIAHDSESSTVIVELAIETIRSIIGMPDDTPPGEPMASAMSTEEEQNAA